MLRFGFRHKVGMVLLAQGALFCHKERYFVTLLCCALCVARQFFCHDIHTILVGMLGTIKQYYILLCIINELRQRVNKRTYVTSIIIEKKKFFGLLQA